MRWHQPHRQETNSMICEMFNCISPWSETHITQMRTCSLQSESTLIYCLGDIPCYRPCIPSRSPPSRLKPVQIKVPSSGYVN